METDTVLKTHYEIRRHSPRTQRARYINVNTEANNCGPHLSTSNAHLGLSPFETRGAGPCLRRTLPASDGWPALFTSPQSPPALVSSPAPLGAVGQ